MTQPLPKITALHPVVLPDNRRITLELTVENLPVTFANVLLTMPDELASAPGGPARPAPGAPSPYPNVELSILDSQRREVASLFIVEHKEDYTALTLHLRAPNPAEPYLARAEMTRNGQTLDVVEAPFTLHQMTAADE